ncbi:protein arginine kinase [Kurthia sibirica]|uniref:Protein-arginine kinase n=1 Tax=Kurthia sibirica TaxID=202750 RepID=A0A2U3AM96_9BACL|nr:protein arginine kinase [Kurthia sibirica]PWI25653.1 protein arginine kinase [Kurthia sibirica]GEK35478.1 protein-arginine kinase [Kurthia sibirica]
MNFEHFLKDDSAAWMSGDQQHGDIVMSTRIRLARNLDGHRFPRAFSEETAMAIDRQVSGVLLDAEQLAIHFSHFDLTTKSALQKQMLVEKHLISPQLAKKETVGSVLLADDESISIMINEEDHIRIQCLEAGLQLEKALAKANVIDDYIEASIDYAFDEKYGYITCCPTNVGTGLRASVMMHLPALTMTNQMRQLISMMPRLGLVVRGLYGEGTEAIGNYYQISNQVTLGKTEEEIIHDLTVIVEQIVLRETAARKAMLEHASIAVSDKLHRAMGTLQHARILTTEEAAVCLSNVRLGIDLGIINSIPNEVLNKCMLAMQQGFLQQYAGTTLKPNERDVYRATLIRDMILDGINHHNGEKGEDSYDV